MRKLSRISPRALLTAGLRYLGTALIMAFCVAVQMGLETQTGSFHLFFLLTGIFAAGLLFDRRAGGFAAGIGLLSAYFSLSERLGPTAWLLPWTLFAATGVGFAVVAEILRKEMRHAREAEKNKGVFLTELAHRTKNNLAMISALLRLQSKQPHLSIGEALEDMSNRIQVMAQVYDHLTIRADKKLVDAREYLTEICQHLAASISGGSPVAIRAEVDELYIHSEQAVPIAMVINELVTNALKYAFPEGRAGLIQVKLHVEEQNIVMSVRDNGVGKKTEPTRGIGSQVLSLLTQQLRGQMVSQNLEQGFGVTLRMPMAVEK